VVDEEALFERLQAGKLKSYVCDFPTSRLKDHPRVIMLPHLGASTGEAEDNCAIMVADQVRDYLETAPFTIPSTSRKWPCRATAAHAWRSSTPTSRT
jgi:D-3-phosphoglycerate dehydrogenase